MINIPLQSRIKSNDLAGVYYAVRDGLGIADLPYITVEEDIKQGQLIQSYGMVLKFRHRAIGLYASSKGQRLVMEKLIDYLVEGLRNLAKEHLGYVL